MKLYRGKRVFNRESMTRGEASVVVQDVISEGPAGRGPTTEAGHGDACPLTHVPYHSPDGFQWGYLGSGPADLALAILADHFDEPPELVLAALCSLWAPRSKAAALHQSFKERFVAIEQRDEWELHSDDIETWLQTSSIRTRLCELARENAELTEIGGSTCRPPRC